MKADLKSFIRRNRAGQPVAVPSVCSSHPDVIAASAMLAHEYDVPLLIEATSNQVNQFGGYTGMRAADFIGFVSGICAKAGLPRDQIIFGGDHLGPQVWRAEAADTAMAHARELLKSFVEAGFTKIHLDCSEGCRGEAAQVSDAVSAERTAALAKVCEENAPDAGSLSYIVGTEVPPPGGARAGDDGIVATSPDSARATLAAQRGAIERHVSGKAWDRVIGLVVQPGLEFSANDVHRFDSGAPDLLSAVLTDHPHLAFEAHSTDYQRPDVFPELARRHFAILKVGPALTFAYRQAIYALDHIGAWYGSSDRRNPLPATMDALMLAESAHWAKHYTGSAAEVHRLRHFGYADRIRYYWPKAEGAVRAVIGGLEQTSPEPPLIEQYFAPAVMARAETLQGAGASWPRALILAQIQEALLPYFACYGEGG
ncbi:class II D-tagatose-bisphosphate aldolase non-catalytic subunit [Mesorhizobium sp. INR15]|uniref:class II D-tagatose-bisphosphate aldolase non-catalytic subunit n=1 Tax=Mesorhizobium sp. INR15 TaxID=2654248 RepID=UPI0018967F1D|nr:class II D-tagatose-bisphosphate aldolase, non-catalytic subunit [Mesorhizobium sp. INR15]QPC91791.1 tagatose-6-phosphate kinase [Mesorhizobium sp. INR15]